MLFIISFFIFVFLPGIFLQKFQQPNGGEEKYKENTWQEQMDKIFGFVLKFSTNAHTRLHLK